VWSLYCKFTSEFGVRVKLLRIELVLWSLHCYTLCIYIAIFTCIIFLFKLRPTVILSRV